MSNETKFNPVRTTTDKIFTVNLSQTKYEELTVQDAIRLIAEEVAKELEITIDNIEFTIKNFSDSLEIGLKRKGACGIIGRFEPMKYDPYIIATVVKFRLQV